MKNMHHFGIVPIPIAPKNAKFQSFQSRRHMTDDYGNICINPEDTMGHMYVSPDLIQDGRVIELKTRR